MNGLLTSLPRPRAWRHAHSQALIWRELLDFRSRSNTRDFPAAAERHKNKAMGEMSGFENRFHSYSTTQLHELLEDDDKLRKIVREMDEVGDRIHVSHETLVLSWNMTIVSLDSECRAVTGARALISLLVLWYFVVFLNGDLSPLTASLLICLKELLT